MRELEESSYHYSRYANVKPWVSGIGIKLMILAISTRAFIMVNFTGQKISLRTSTQSLAITPVLGYDVITILMLMICVKREITFNFN